MAVSSLVSLNLIVRVSVDLLEQPKYKCVAPLTTVQTLAKESSIDFEQFYYNYWNIFMLAWTCYLDPAFQIIFKYLLYYVSWTFINFERLDCLLGGVDNEMELYECYEPCMLVVRASDGHPEGASPWMRPSKVVTIKL